MAENVGKEIKKKIDAALNYTNGNLEVAKKIVAGQYQDLIALKARFKDDSDNFFGLYVLYFSKEIHELVGIQTCVSTSPSIYNHKPFEPWASYENTIAKELNLEHDKNRTDKLYNLLMDNLNNEQVVQIVHFVNGSNFQGLDEIFQGFLKAALESDSITNQIEVEKTNSADFDIKSSFKLNIFKSDAEEEDITFTSPSSDPFAGNVVLSANPVLSPQKGKLISQLEEGDNIKVIISEKTKKAINIATKLDVYSEEGEMQPIIAEVERYNKVGDFHEIHASIAPYILVKLSEETNVKVSVVESAFEDVSSKKSKKNAIIALGAIFVIVLIIIIILSS